jgi:hypothetical protein
LILSLGSITTTAIPSDLSLSLSSLSSPPFLYSDLTQSLTTVREVAYGAGRSLRGAALNVHVPGKDPRVGPHARALLRFPVRGAAERFHRSLAEDARGCRYEVTLRSFLCVLFVYYVIMRVCSDDTCICCLRLTLSGTRVSEAASQAAQQRSRSDSQPQPQSQSQSQPQVSGTAQAQEHAPSHEHDMLLLPPEAPRPPTEHLPAPPKIHPLPEPKDSSAAVFLDTLM